MRKDMKADYDLICKELPVFGRRFSLKDYSTMRIMTASRVFEIMVDGRETLAMVPYADMLNHKMPQETYW